MLDNNKSISEYLSLKGGPKYMSIMAVIDSTGKIDDDRPINDFFNNVSLNYPSRIVTEQYTIEGEPKFKIIEFDGKRIKYVDDASKTVDKYIKAYRGNNFKKINDGERIRYALYKDDKLVTEILSYKILD